MCSSGTEPFKHIFNSGALRLDLDLARSVSVFFELCGSTSQKLGRKEIGETLVVDVVASCNFSKTASPSCLLT